ncbi:uncharacterized protein LOC130622358 [Hydractinia symbiolongicarpus]|uniref:uncharacterized protein LOC130622358 n=1 Tax=Hydractinia symbiolongicarpus TaxID=13093 RepID=UPI00255044C4|nr:uncharacterized protein LOC130622358 [Hydractinia symbiolongicarpus]
MCIQGLIFCFVYLFEIIKACGKIKVPHVDFKKKEVSPTNNACRIRSAITWKKTGRLIIMSFSYEVILRPKDIKFTAETIPSKFDNGVLLSDLVQKIVNGDTLAKDIPTIQVIWFCDKWKWYALNNRRLWVLQELEKREKLSYVSMNRVELSDLEYEYPKELFDTVNLYEPEWNIRSSNNNFKVGCNRTLNNVPNLTQTKKVIKNSSKVAAFAAKTEKHNTLLEQNGTEMDIDKELSDSCEIIKSIKQEVLSDSDDTSQGQKKETSHTKNKNMRSVVRKVDNKNTDNVSEYSTDSVSSITRKQRVLDSSSGLFGYGYYHIYKSEYLDKIRVAKNKVIKRYKPFNVNRGPYQSLRSSRCSSFTSLVIGKNGNTRKDLISNSGDSNALQISEYPFPNGRRHSISGYPNDRGLKSSMGKQLSIINDNRPPSSRKQSSRYNKGSCYLTQDRSFYSRNHSASCIRLYSDNVDYNDHDNVQGWESNFDSHFGWELERSSSSNDYRPFKHSRAMSCESLSLCSYSNMEVSTRSSGVKLSVLYELWQKRRAEFLKNQFGRRAISNAFTEPYMCGLCFKSFNHIVDLQQHSEALMHFACITCGKFFSSYASLGQHCRYFNHKKD